MIGKYLKAQEKSHIFDVLIDTAANYIVVLNDSAEVMHISTSFLNWLDIKDKSYAISRPLRDLLPPGEIQLMLQEIMEHQGFMEKHFSVDVGGKTFWFLARSSTASKHKATRFIELMDITLIMDAKNDAEAASKAKSDFLAHMSHEIRTPINAIVGLTDLLLLTLHDKEQIQHAITIKNASNSLLQIINDILDFSKISAKKMEIVKEPFDFVSFIHDVINLNAIWSSETQIAFTTFISKNVPLIIHNDALRLKQVLINLLGNAIKFTSRGCVSLHVLFEPSRLESPAKLHFIVKDTGIGIKKESLGKMFKEFEQFDSHRNKSSTGSGLGLAISQHLVELMGGKIGVESVYGYGSTFSFYIPCGEYHEKVVHLENPEDYRVLCFEPNAYNGDEFHSMMKDLGIDHHICNDIPELQEKLSDRQYTHIFFDKNAEKLLRLFPGSPETSFTLIKEVHETDRGLDYLPHTAINRPVLTTSLVKILEGRSEDEISLQNYGEEKLGQFKTKDVSVLVVDDNAVNLLVVEGMLKQYGIYVRVSSGGREAVEIVKTERFDIIFMDHMMPEMNGLEASKAIRGLNANGRSVPIIALSANTIAGAKELFLDAGMNDFIPKPIEIRKLNKVLLDFLPSQKVLKI